MHRHLLHHRTTDKTGSRWLLIGDIAGWVGAAGLLGAYLLVSFGIVDAQSMTYQLMNIVGAVGMLILALARKATPSAFVNIVWSIISIVAIIGILSASF